MELVSASGQITDGGTISLPNKLHDISFSVQSKGVAQVVVIHAVYRPDGRVGTTTYTVRVHEIWNGTEYDAGNYEYEAIVPVSGLKAFHVGLEVKE